MPDHSTIPQERPQPRCCAPVPEHRHVNRHQGLQTVNTSSAVSAFPGRSRRCSWTRHKFTIYDSRFTSFFNSQDRENRTSKIVNDSRLANFSLLRATLPAAALTLPPCCRLAQSHRISNCRTPTGRRIIARRFQGQGCAGRHLHVQPLPLCRPYPLRPRPIRS